MKWWITFNEPLLFTKAYGNYRETAQGIDGHGIGESMAAHTVLLAHARVYHLYDTVFRNRQKGTQIQQMASGSDQMWILSS